LFTIYVISYDILFLVYWVLVLDFLELRVISKFNTWHKIPVPVIERPVQNTNEKKRCKITVGRNNLKYQLLWKKSFVRREPIFVDFVGQPNDEFINPMKNIFIFNYATTLIDTMIYLYLDIIILLGIWYPRI
jgi:hypothetical protein